MLIFHLLEYTPKTPPNSPTLNSKLPHSLNPRPSSGAFSYLAKKPLFLSFYCNQDESNTTRVSYLDPLMPFRVCIAIYSI